MFLMKIEVISFAPLSENRYDLLVPSHDKECSRLEKNPLLQKADDYLWLSEKMG